MGAYLEGSSNPVEKFVNRRGPKALAKARSSFPSLAFEVDSFSYMIQVMRTSGYPVTQGLLWPERIGFVSILRKE